MPSEFITLFICLVAKISSVDGVGIPPGWLCAIAMQGDFAASAVSVILLTLTGVKDGEPSHITVLEISRRSLSKQANRNSSFVTPT